MLQKAKLLNKCSLCAYRFYLYKKRARKMANHSPQFEDIIDHFTIQMCCALQIITPKNTLLIPSTYFRRYKSL